MSAAPLFRLRGIAFAYPGRPPLLRDLDLDLHPGERLAISGRNGAGKTTLLHLMVGLRRASAGQVIAFGAERRREADFREVRARAGLVFQDADDQLFCPTVRDDVAFGPLNLGHDRAAAERIANATLAELGLADLAPRLTYQLSGGEKRLVSLAAVLAMQPDALLLDEPFNGLDADAAAMLLRHLARLPQAMLLVAHDRRLVERLATREMHLAHGRLWAAGSAPD